MNGSQLTIKSPHAVEISASQRLLIIWDRICTAAFWAVYRGSEIVPQIRMNHRDMQLLEQRIEKLETRLRQLGEATVTGSDRT